MALKSIAELENKLSHKAGQVQSMGQRYRSLEQEHVKTNEILELAYNFMSTRGLMEDFEQFLATFLSSSASPPGSPLTVQRESSLEGQVEVLSAAVRQGDSGMVLRFFDNLDTRVTDKREAAGQDGGGAGQDGPAAAAKEPVSKKQPRSLEGKNEDTEGKSSKVNVGKNPQAAPKKQLSIEGSAAMETITSRPFGSMDYIPKSIADDRKITVDYVLKNGGALSDDVRKKIIGMPFNSSSTIPESVRDDRSAFFEVFENLSPAVKEEMQSMALDKSGEERTLGPPPVHVLAEVQTRRFGNESHVPLAIQNDRRAFLSNLFEHGNATIGGINEALSMPYNNSTEIPTSVMSDRSDTVRWMFGDILEEQNPEPENEPAKTRPDNTDAEEKSDRPDDQNDTLPRPEFSRIEVVDHMPYKGSMDIPSSIRHDRRELLSCVYEAPVHTIPILVDFVICPHNFGTEQYEHAPEHIQVDRLSVLNVLFGDDVTALVAIHSRPFDGMAKAPKHIERDRQQILQIVLQAEEITDEICELALNSHYEGDTQSNESTTLNKVQADRSETIKILIERSAPTEEDIEAERLTQEGMQLKEKIMTLPFLDLFEVPESVRNDREEMMALFFDNVDTTEEEVREILLNASYAGSPIVPSTIAQDRHARIAILLGLSDMDSEVKVEVDDNGNTVISSPTHAMPPVNSEKAKALIAQQESDIHQLLNAPFMGSDEVPTAVRHDREITLRFVMDNPDMELTELRSHILNASYNDMVDVPNSIREDREQQLDILLQSDEEPPASPEQSKIANSAAAAADENENSNTDDVQNHAEPEQQQKPEAENDAQQKPEAENEAQQKEDNVNSADLGSSKPTEDTNSTKLTIVDLETKGNVVEPDTPDAQRQEGPSANVVDDVPSSPASPTHSKGNEGGNQEVQNLKPVSDPTCIAPASPNGPEGFPSGAEEIPLSRKDEMKELSEKMKKVPFSEAVALDDLPPSIRDERDTIIDLAMQNFETPGELEEAVDCMFYMGSSIIPPPILTYRKNLVNTVLNKSLLPLPKTIGDPWEEEELLKLYDKILSQNFGDSGTNIPEAVVADREARWVNVKSCINPDKILEGSVTDDDIETLIEAVVLDAAFQGVSGGDIPEEVIIDRRNTLALIFPAKEEKVKGSTSGQGDKGELQDGSTLSSSHMEDELALKEKQLEEKIKALEQLEASLS
jgi:hypothetical protein